MKLVPIRATTLDHVETLRQIFNSGLEGHGVTSPLTPEQQAAWWEKNRFSSIVYLYEYGGEVVGYGKLRRDVVAFLASDGARYVNGQSIRVDGGFA